MSITQRISQPRQKSSSTIGTMMIARVARSRTARISARASSGNELSTVPVIEFCNSQCSRHAGNSRSGPIQITNTPTPSATLPNQWVTRKSRTRREKIQMIAVREPTRMRPSTAGETGSFGPMIRKAMKAAKGAVHSRWSHNRVGAAGWASCIGIPFVKVQPAGADRSVVAGRHGDIGEIGEDPVHAEPQELAQLGERIAGVIPVQE